MRQAAAHTTVNDLRLAPQVLMPGESISSLVDRQAQLWDISRRDLVNQVTPYSPAGPYRLRGRYDLDERGSCELFLDQYATKIGLTKDALLDGTADYSCHLVYITYRNAYCPICFSLDAASGKTPYFRLDWARVFLTHCRDHDCPLFPWPKITSEGLRKLPHSWFMGGGPEISECPQFLRDLHLAKVYAFRVRPLTQSSIEAWKRTCRFEEWLYRKRVGATREHRGRHGIHVLEDDVIDRATALARTTRNSGRLTRDDHEFSFEEQRVMTFVMTAGESRGVRWLELRTGFRSIAKRRALIYATSFDFL